MAVIWIARDVNGMIEAASVVPFADRSVLRAWKAMGRLPELIEAASVTLGEKLPEDARFLSVEKHLIEAL